jgi:hypothetical protein
LDNSPFACFRFDLLPKHVTDRSAEAREIATTEKGNDKEKLR